MNLASRFLRRDDYILGDLFGPRFHPILKVWKNHDGIDIKTFKQKWRIQSLECGIVVSVGYDISAGNYVRIMYRRIGYIIRLYHLDSYNVKKGDYITSSTFIGLVGTTGGSTGIHLHIGVQRIGSNKYIDPMLIDYIPPEDERLEEDGILGPKTLYKIQLIYNQFPDCEISGQRNALLVMNFKFIKPGTKGSLLVKSIQKDVGARQDGLLGPETFKAMQKATNTPITGKLLKVDDPMIREVQRRINNKERLWG